MEQKFTNWREGERAGLCQPCLVMEPPRETRTKMQFHWEPTWGEEKEAVGNHPMYCCSPRCAATTGRRLRPEEYVGWVRANPDPVERWLTEAWQAVHAGGPLCALVSGDSDGQSHSPAGTSPGKNDEVTRGEKIPDRAGSGVRSDDVLRGGAEDGGAGDVPGPAAGHLDDDF